MPRRQRLASQTEAEDASLLQEVKQFLGNQLRTRKNNAVVLGSTSADLVSRTMHAMTDYLCKSRLLSHWPYDGLKMAEDPSVQEVCHQSRTLIREYLYVRLRSEGLLSGKAELTGAGSMHSDVSKQIQTVAAELENMFPNLYNNISRQLSITMSSDKIVRQTFSSLAEQMLKAGCTWGKVVALFSISGAFAVDCVTQGHPEFVSSVVDCFVEAIKKLHLDVWIVRQGGWADIIRTFRDTKETRVVWALSVCGAVLGFLVTMGFSMNL